MAENKTNHDSLGARLMGMVASLCFSVPTAGLIWLGLNRDLALYASTNSYLGADWLIAGIVLLGVLAFFVPDLFTSLLSRIWRWLYWWG